MALYIIANWKMNKTIQEAETYVQALLPLMNTKACLWMAVPFTALRTVRNCMPAVHHVGAQNMHDVTQGSFTGEISGPMLVDAGADFVILGHSERRHIFHEDNSFINAKVRQASSLGLRPVLCVGERYEERHKRREVLNEQISQGLKGLTKRQGKRVIIAYEPVWAIGTGVVATVEDIRAAISEIQEIVPMPITAILYGGSVSPDSIQEILAVDGVQGVLVGTASLDPQVFAKIVSLSHNKNK